ncbi:MAG: FAD-dependent oxidoreductase [Thermomicrobiales bacterium]
MRSVAIIGAGIVGASLALELATSSAGVAEITRRATAARATGLQARVVDPSDAEEVLPAFVDISQVIAAAYFEDDGAAEVKQLHHTIWQQGVEHGARFLSGHEVLGINRRGQGYVLSTTGDNELEVDDIVLAGGVWGPSLAAMVDLDLPLFPVAHPYVYARHDDAMKPGPIIRWPEHHVYARVHQDRLGIGSYDHTPILVDQESLANGAGIPWTEAFEPAIAAAQLLLRREARFSPDRRINGVFAMTPDNLPFLGHTQQWMESGSPRQSGSLSQPVPQRHSLQP